VGGTSTEIFGVSLMTFWRWEEKKLIIPERTPSGHRRYKLSQVKSFDSGAKTPRKVLEN
jgi:putative resolvase